MTNVYEPCVDCKTPGYIVTINSDGTVYTSVHWHGCSGETLYRGTFEECETFRKTHAEYLKCLRIVAPR